MDKNNWNFNLVINYILYKYSTIVKQFTKNVIIETNSSCCRNQRLPEGALPLTSSHTFIRSPSTIRTEISPNKRPITVHVLSAVVWKI